MQMPRPAARPNGDGPAGAAHTAPTPPAARHRDVRRFLAGSYFALFLVLAGVAAVAVAERADGRRAAEADLRERSLALRLGFVRQDVGVLNDVLLHAAEAGDSAWHRRYGEARTRLAADIDSVRRSGGDIPLIRRGADELATYAGELDAAIGQARGANVPLRAFDSLVHVMRDRMETTDSEVRRRFGSADSTFLSRTERASTVIAVTLLAALFGLALSGVLLVNDLRSLQRADATQRDLVASLEAALAEVRTLRGILPICSGCKRIRDDVGSWSEVEAYVSAHTDAEFSHGLCEACMTRLYPEFSG